MFGINISIFNEFLFLGQALFSVLCLFGMVVLSYEALAGFLVLQFVLANVFVTKQIVLFGISTTCSEVFIVSGMYGISLIRDQYGQRKALHVLWLSFAALVFVMLLTQIHLLYAHTEPIGVERAYSMIFKYTPRILLASLAAYTVSERLHLLFVSFFRLIFSPMLADVTALWCGQLADTALFAIIGLLGIVASVGQVIVMSMGIKTILILIIVPILNIVRDKIFPNMRPLA